MIQITLWPPQETPMALVRLCVIDAWRLLIRADKTVKEYMLCPHTCILEVAMCFTFVRQRQPSVLGNFGKIKTDGGCPKSHISLPK